MKPVERQALSAELLALLAPGRGARLVLIVANDGAHGFTHPECTEDDLRTALCGLERCADLLTAEVRS